LEALSESDRMIFKFLWLASSLRKSQAKKRRGRKKNLFKIKYKNI